MPGPNTWTSDSSGKKPNRRLPDAVDGATDGLPVTAVETWIRDPYALYAERILNLRALEPIDADPGAADRGSIVHDVLEDFIAAHPDTLPDDAERVLIDIGKGAS